jgi:hypothetical protein
MRTLPEASDLLWIGWFLDLVWVFFFIFFYIRLYAGKKVIYGILYGIYITLFFTIINHFNIYRLVAFPPLLLFEGILFGLIVNILLGSIIAFMYSKNSPGIGETA